MANAQSSTIMLVFSIDLIFLRSGWVKAGIESVSSRKTRRRMKILATTAKSPATIPAPAAPAGQTG
jgi:hypothetical protein